MTARARPLRRGEFQSYWLAMPIRPWRDGRGSGGVLSSDDFASPSRLSPKKSVLPTACSPATPARMGSELSSDLVNRSFMAQAPKRREERRRQPARCPAEVGAQRPAAMSRHLIATSPRLLSSACLARARAIVFAASPCSVTRCRAALAISWARSMSDYGAQK
jgi:hypothetical protein